MFRNLPDEPPPAIPGCPVCGQPMDYSYVTLGWQCLNSDCPQDAVFSLVAVRTIRSAEADQRRRKAYLDELDNAVEDDDDCEDEQDEW